jgi:heptosyltransferase II
MAPSSPHRRVERILVIQTAFLGDIILATPFLAALRASFPAAEIRLLTTGGGKALLDPNPWGVIPVPYEKRGREAGIAGFWAKARGLRLFRPELVFCLHRSLRSVLLARLAGGESWGFQEAAASFFLRKRVSRKGYGYEAEKNLALLQDCLGGGSFSPFPKLEFSKDDSLAADGLLEGRRNFVVLAPSSVWATKRWPASRFGELAFRLLKEHKLSAVIVGADEPEDHKAAAETVASFLKFGGAEPPLNLTGRTGIGALKSVMSRARLVVSNDSSPLHMAIALGAKAVGIFGPTTRELGFFPLAPPGLSAVAELQSLSCRPCGPHGHRQCPEGHFRCMLNLGVDPVYSEVDRLLCQ